MPEERWRARLQWMVVKDVKIRPAGKAANVAGLDGVKEYGDGNMEFKNQASWVIQAEFGLSGSREGLVCLNTLK